MSIHYLKQQLFFDLIGNIQSNVQVLVGRECAVMDQKNAAPQLHAVASTWSSCVKLSVQRVFLGIATDLYNTIYGGDATNDYANAPAPNDTFLNVDNAYMNWFKMRFPGRLISRKYVLPVHHVLQGHPEKGKMWMHFIDNI